jgi:L-ascorbate metabolism protein UlaG (beta-lactamase superfamily)
MRLTYYGHSCFLLETMGKKILFDPFISHNELAKNISVDTVEADFILISHGHEDHIADAVSIAKRTGAKVVSNYEVVNWLAKQGVENNHPMNHGGKWDFGFGKVKYVNAVHSSSLPDGTYGGNPGGFLVRNDEGVLYFAGDTALTYDMKLWGELYKIDMAILPIGDNFTMGYRDAAIASVFLNCPNVVGMHYDTFGFIRIDHDDAKKAFEERGRKLTLLGIGESCTFEKKQA